LADIIMLLSRERNVMEYKDIKPGKYYKGTNTWRGTICEFTAIHYAHVTAVQDKHIIHKAFVVSDIKTELPEEVDSYFATFLRIYDTEITEEEYLQKLAEINYKASRTQL
jgi:hypothetical protein